MNATQTHSQATNRLRLSHWLKRALALALASTIHVTMLSKEGIELFIKPDLRNDWAIVNDTVMGGVSKSRIETTEAGNILFEGNLSLRNNGGFVSIRSRPTDLALSEASSIKLRVRGDGRTYYLDLRSSRQMAARSFRASFTTGNGKWTEISIPFTDFVLQSFGRTFANSTIKPDTIISIGFTLADKQPGPFKIEIEYAKAIDDVSAKISRNNRPIQIEPNRLGQQKPLIELSIERAVPLFNNGRPAA